MSLSLRCTRDNCSLRFSTWLTLQRLSVGDIQDLNPCFLSGERTVSIKFSGDSSEFQARIYIEHLFFFEVNSEREAKIWSSKNTCQK